MTIRDYSVTDKFCMQLDTALRTIFGKPKTTDRENPAKYIKDLELSA